MMKPFFVLLLALMATTSVQANPQLERSLQNIETSSNALWVDAAIHIRSMDEKFKALPKGADGFTNSNAFVQLAKATLNKTSTILTNASNLREVSYAFMKVSREDDLWLLGSTDGKIPPVDRLNAAIREIKCVEFSLELTFGAESVLKDATALANTVLTSCKTLNDLQLRKTVAATMPVETDPPLKTRKKK